MIFEEDCQIFIFFLILQEVFRYWWEEKGKHFHLKLLLREVL